MKLLEKLVSVLGQKAEFVIDGQLLKNKIVESALKADGEMLALLAADEKLKSVFFKDIGSGMLVFDKDKLIKFVSSKEFLPDSYTAFKNKIGLFSDGEYLKADKSVVLAWPYKDCVLEGGQSREDAKTNEIFWNETLAPDETELLLKPKTLTGFKRLKIREREITSGDAEVVEERNFELQPTDNLIIKGNNLLALHSLKERFRGQVKLIYIDPPYNTGSDSFGYNDSFNHATWLTFMKNRLEAAIELLHTDGVMAVHCSFHEYAYLKVLMDEVFTRECELCTFNIQVRHPDRILTGDKPFNDVVEYILLYSKNKGYKFPKRVTAKVDEDYIFQIVTNGTPEIIQCGDKQVEVYLPEQYQEVRGEPNSTSFKTISVRGSIREKNSSGRFYVRYLEPLKEQYPPRTLFKVPNMGDDMYDFRYFHLPVEGNKNGTYYQGKPTSSDVTETPYANFYNFEREYNTVADEGDVSFRNGKKPEEMIMFLIELFTKKDEIVLDYHLGSGTTAAVAHKLGRQYIGVEQMNYIQTITAERLCNVITGEQSGISKNIAWQGGGSFVYCELMELNVKYIDQIEAATTSEQLKIILEAILADGYIKYKIDPEICITEFDSIENIEDKKQALIDILDKNYLYVNYSEINDRTNQVSDEDKAFNRQFYGDAR